ncbi:hypothetical protein C8Q80DRAFT_1150163 [Daedaleopsis nitida]|nr:hypothetical protein C8Q80DRAFT_1150163 [Daedaleopsis nitida]
MSTPARIATHKNALAIRLAESVVFLRAGDATGRQRTISADASPGMVRGILVLNLAKPTRITSIEVELVGKTVTAWPEGVGARRIEIAEEHEIYSQTYVFFRAGHAQGMSYRRNLSVGPGLALDHEDEDHSERSSYVQPEEPTEERRGRSPPPRGSDQVRPQRRYMSVDQTHFQRSFVSHRENPHPSASSPPYTPPHSSIEMPLQLSPATVMHRPPLATHDESPSRSLEDLRRALEAGEHFNDYTHSPSRQSPATSSIWSPREVPDSRRVSYDEDREFQLGTQCNIPLGRGARTPSQSVARDSRTPSRQRDTEGDDRGRKGKRFSFASAFLEAMKDRVRSNSPLLERHAGQSRDKTPPRGRTRDRNLLESGISTGHESTTLDRVSEALGDDANEGREHGHGWKEFRKGVYTYPISFAIPANAPPSLHVDYGSVIWKLKAVVHRPGAFTTKLTASQEITVVATPGEDDTEESESIIVERQWDTQMQYIIVISGRSFSVGGTMPISVTFMPWTKMKVHRISVLIEERVDYWTGFRRVARTDPLNRVSLLSLKCPKKDGPPLLPLLSDNPDAFKRSPLSEIVNSEDDISELVSNYMGPGPWTLRTELRLPNSGNVLHTTNKNRRSNISVSHMLKIIFRVERGDDSAVDPQSGKRKLFDIVVQTPVHILSHLCNPEYTSLPPYTCVPEPTSPALHPSAHHALSVLSEGSLSRTRMPVAPTPGASALSQRSTSVSAPGMQASSTTSSLSGRTRGRSPANPVQSPDQSLDWIPHPSPSVSVVASPAVSRRPSFQECGTPELFERLVAGQETEEGEAPPSYEVAVET